MKWPNLSSEFFSKHAPAISFWEKWEQKGSWSQDVVPLYEWENVLFVGVSGNEDPVDMSLPGYQCVFVKTPPLELGKFLLKMQTQQVQVVNPQISEDSRGEGIAVAPPAAKGKAPPAESNKQNVIELADEPQEGSKADEAGDKSAVSALDGVILDAKVSDTLFKPSDRPKTAPATASTAAPLPKINIGNAPAKIPTPTQVAAPPTAQEEKPIKTKSTTVKRFSAPPPPPAKAKPGFGSASQPPPPPKSAISTKPVPAATEAAAAAAFNIPRPAANPAKAKESSGIANSVPAARPAIAPAPSSEGGPPPLSAQQIADRSKEVVGKIFEQLKLQYGKSLILRKFDSYLIPWKWDPNFKEPTESSDRKVDLETPSPFRIAFRTHKSYHGYVVAGEIQEKFFDLWNNSDIPDLLTVAPVVVADQVVAEIVCLGDSNVNQKLSLNIAEKAALDLANFFTNVPEAMSA